MILIRRQAFLAALSASLNFGDSVPSLPRAIEACIAPSACCSYSRFNSWPSLVLTPLRAMILSSAVPPDRAHVGGRPQEVMRMQPCAGSVRQVLQRRSWLAGVMRLGGAGFSCAL